MKQRPESNRPKMPLSQRAKQFAPFDALTGLTERLDLAVEEHRSAMEKRTQTYAHNEDEFTVEEKDK